jgi:hypothetical protein
MTKTRKELLQVHLDQFKNGIYTHTTGFIISWEEFCMVAEIVSKAIPIYGWIWYQDYINKSWWVRIDDATTRK